MNFLRSLSALFYLSCLTFLGACGIVHYPGQPGMVASSFVKVDLEILEEPGLFVYEAVYDNTSAGTGVSAVITKLYPKAQTYTSNVRTNADGTLFKVKGQYNGADIQMISMPQQNQVYLNPNHQIAFLVDYDLSLDEIDDKNVAEQNLFKPSSFQGLSPQSFETKRMRWELIKASRFLPSGNLAYEVTAVGMGGTKYVPAEPINLETSLAQNAIKTTLNTQTKQDFSQFLETHFPKGYKGKIDFYVKDSTQPLSFEMGVNTLKTAEASGIKIIKDLPDSLVRKLKGNL